MTARGSVVAEIEHHQHVLPSAKLWDSLKSATMPVRKDDEDVPAPITAAMHAALCIPHELRKDACPPAQMQRLASMPPAEVISSLSDMVTEGTRGHYRRLLGCETYARTGVSISP